MPTKQFKPTSPGRRGMTGFTFQEITKSKPEKSLVEIRKKTGGRNHYGRATARGIGGGHKQKIRLVDFKRNKHGVEATVSAIEYDPGRSARLALLETESRSVVSMSRSCTTARSAESESRRVKDTKRPSALIESGVCEN